VADRPRATVSWMLAASSALLLVIVLYLLFGAYLPTKKRITRLEVELKDVYAREAQLQTRAAKEAEKSKQGDQQVTALTAEREALTKKVEELEKELAAARKGGARPRR
jgi:type II secretory pathway component PulM